MPTNYLRIHRKGGFMIKREEILKNSSNSKEAEVSASREGEGLVSQEEALDFLGADLE